jgi:hypothetical protein
MSEDKPVDDVAPWTAASESLRSVVKWIAGSFGALGALLIGTAPLAGFHDSTFGVWTAWIGPIGFGALSLIGVVIVVWLATSLLTPSTVTLSAVQHENTFHVLRAQVAADPTAYLGLWGTDIDSFMENRQTEFTALANVDSQITSLPSDDPRIQGLTAARPLLLKGVEACGKVSARLLAVAAFHDLSQRFSKAKPKIFGAALLVVVGVIGFSATTPKPDKSNTATQPLPVSALIALTTEGKSTVGLGLGPACPDSFQAVVLSGGSGGPWQILVTDPRCTSGTTTLSNKQASVISVFPR